MYMYNTIATQFLNFLPIYLLNNILIFFITTAKFHAPGSAYFLFDQGS